MLIPKSVTSIGAGAFAGCTALTAIDYSGTGAEWAQLTKGENALPEGVTVNFNAPIHHYGSWTGTDPNCTTEGKRTRTCTDDGCGHTEEMTLPARGHYWGVGRVTTPPTETTAGVRTYTCQIYGCNATRTEEIPKLAPQVPVSERFDDVDPDGWACEDIQFDGAKICYEHPDHVFDPLTNTPATCTDDGRIAGTCTVCGYSMDTVLPAYGHIWNSGTLLAAPEGVRCGIVEHTCGRCNGTGYEVLDPEIWAYEQFGDVDPTLWSYEGIQFCVMMGYMSGMDTHVFAPRGVTTRAQLVQILYNFVGGPEVSGETPFTDLTANWYKDAVLWAYQTGVTSGTSETTFSPDDPVTREQVAVLLHEFADKVLELGGAETPADLSRFPDGDQVSSWAREAMADAVALGIINGTKVDDQVFLAPQGSATRDQIATMFEGFCASLA